MEGFEAMLGRMDRKGLFNVGEEEAFKDFSSRTKERDRKVGGGEVRRFARFKEGDDFGEFPNGGDVGREDRNVEKFGKEGDAIWTKVLKVEDIKVIRAEGRGIRGLFYCFKEVMVKVVVAAESMDNISGKGIGSVMGN